MGEHEKNIKRIKKMIQDKKCIDDILDKGGCCCICGYNEDISILEEHHIAGKNNSKLTITVCPNHHRILSNDQKSWGKQWTKKDNSPKMNLAYFRRGRSRILKEMAKEDKKLSDKILNGEL